MDIISRQKYATRIDDWLNKEQIIVLVGQRRIGKSFVMKDFIARHENEAHANIIYIDKEKKSFDFIHNYEQLNAFLDAHFQKDCHNYILIDEVQDIEGWERTVRSFRTEEHTDIIITGSNSKMLSGELSTLLGGRYVQIHIQGLSYLEFLEFHEIPDDDNSLGLYLTYGGLPGLRNVGLDHEEMVNEYLLGVFNTIMLKDIIERHTIRNIAFLRNLISFMSDTVGKLNSASSIAKYMKSQGQDVSINAVLSYMSYFHEAYLTCSVPRYDIHGKKLLESNDKCYFGDLGLRNLIAGGNREKDIEKVMENVVYQHLLRMGYDVKVGQLRAGEIDFVCAQPAKKIYVQVAYLIADESTRKREFGNLRLIPDDYPKFVVSLSPLVKRTDDEGITHIHLREFLKLAEI